MAALVAGALVSACSAPSATPTTTPTPAASPTASATPTASAPATPIPAPRLRWDEAVVPASESGSAMLGVAPGGDGLIGIGFDGVFGSLLWTSIDGNEWADVTPPAFRNVGMAGVEPFGDLLVGVGIGNSTDVDDQRAYAFLSEDGTAWRMAAGPGGSGQLVDAVATDDAIFAVGGIPGADSATIWRSQDGDAWQQSGTDLEHAFLWAIADGGPGLVAVGWRRNPEPWAAVWTSTDGETWELAPDPDGAAGFEMTNVVEVDGRLVAVGSALTGDEGRIWTSSDGLAWAEADVEGGLAGAGLRGVLAIPAGIVAVGYREGSSGALWLSTDGGATWAPFGELLPESTLTNAYAVEGGLLVTGATQTGTLETGIDSRARIWLATIGEG